MAEIEKEKQQPFNGKAVYVKKAHDEDAFTVGKVYEFKDGRTKDDNGTTRPCKAVDAAKIGGYWFRRRFLQLIE